MRVLAERPHYMRDKLTPLGFEVDVIQTPRRARRIWSRGCAALLRSASPSCCAPTRTQWASSAIQYPGTVVTRALYEAGTDAEPWRQRGIAVYGLRPYPASAAILEDMHGIDERVSLTGLNQGTDMVERSLRAVAAG